MAVDFNRQYNQGEVPDNVYNKGNNDVVNFDGSDYRLIVNNNGTRSFKSLYDPVDLNAGVNKAAANTAGMQTLLAGQKAEGSDFLNRYTNTLGGQETSAAMAARLGREAGLPQLQQNAANSRQALFDIPNVYKNAVTGTDTNANQLSRVVNTKTAELSPLAQREQEAVNAAKGLVNEQIGYGMQDNDRALLPYEKEQQILSERQARELTGYNTSMQAELDAVLNKMATGVTLSEGEKNRANELAVLEKTFQNNMSIARESAKAKTDNGLMTLSEGQTVYDPATGKSLYTAGKTYAPSSGGSSGGTIIGGGSGRAAAGF